MATSSSNMINGYGYSLAVIVVDSAFAGITWYICMSLFVRVFILFKKYNSLYFWSLLVASFATFLQPTCFLLKDFHVGNINAIEAVSTLSWYGMITGQAIVLYSRLHLVIDDRQKVKWVLYMIIFNFFVLHLPTTFLTNMSHQPKFAPRFDPIYAIYEKIQLTGFFIQETIISGLYIWQVRRIMKTRSFFREKETVSVVKHLICVNIFVILLDIALISTEFANQYRVQTVFKCAVYSIKLELEFSILNRLRTLILSSRSTLGGTPARDASNGSAGKDIHMGVLKPGSSTDSDISVLVVRDSAPSPFPKQTTIVNVTPLDPSARRNNARDLERGEIRQEYYALTD